MCDGLKKNMFLLIRLETQAKFAPITKLGLPANYFPKTKIRV